MDLCCQRNITVGGAQWRRVGEREGGGGGGGRGERERERERKVIFGRTETNSTFPVAE